jgi:subfamily B ATP-binding cassette protein MsbA
MQMWQKIKSFVRNDNPEAQIKWSLYGRVWREFGLPYWKLLALGVTCTIIAAAAEAYSITLLGTVVDSGIVEQKIEVLWIVGLQIIAAFSVKSVFGYAKTVTMAKAGLLGVSTLRRRMYKHLLKQPLGFFYNQQTGALINQFTMLADAVLRLVTDNVITIVHSTATMAMMIGLMFWFAPQMTFVLLFLAPAILVPLIIIMRKQRIIVRRHFSVHAKSISHINQSILGIRTIQSFVMEEPEQKKMGEIEDARIKAVYKTTQLIGLQTPLLEIMISVGLCIALISGGYLIMSGAMTTGGFLVFIVALVAMYKPAKMMADIGNGIQSGLIAADGLFNFLDRKPEIIDAPDAMELQPAPMRVKLDQISFAYNNADGNVLHNVSLEVQPGTICAFVGPSGGGKSTIFNLLGRFYDPQHGSVLINGTDIRQFTLASLHGNIAMVSQDVFLFDGTIADNIKYGSPDATEEQVVAAARAANAHEFIMSFPKQYDNEVGERGTLLSGGQKQRVAIARAVLKDAPILLLDEATAALDSHSEQQIQMAFKKLMQGRTTFVIAHRLATVLDADIIYVIKNGRIIEKGTDAELYSLGGEYKKLKDIQFNDSDKG